MGRPRKEKPQGGVEPQGQQPPLSGEARTVTVRFDESGKPLPMRQEARERLRAALPHLGLSEEFPEGEVPHKLIAEEIFAGLCVAVLWTQSLLMEYFTGLPPDKTREILRYTKEEKNEMREPAVMLLAEHLGSLWRTDPNLYMLLIVLTVFHFEKATRIASAVKKNGASAGESEMGGAQ